MRLRHPDQVKNRLMTRFGLSEWEATFIILFAEGEYSFFEPPADEIVTATLRRLVRYEFLQEMLADLDANE